MARPARFQNLGSAVLADRAPSRVNHIFIGNLTGATAYVQCFNTGATANVTLGTTVPDAEFAVPTIQFVPIPFPESGLIFGNGLVIAATTTSGGSTAAGSGVLVTLAED